MSCRFFVRAVSILIIFEKFFPIMTIYIETTRKQMSQLKFADMTFYSPPLLLVRVQVFYLRLLFLFFVKFAKDTCSYVKFIGDFENRCCQV